MDEPSAAPREVTLIVGDTKYVRGIHGEWSCNGIWHSRRLLDHIDTLRAELTVARDNADTANTELRKISMVLNHELSARPEGSLSDAVAALQADRGRTDAENAVLELAVKWVTRQSIRSGMALQKAIRTLIAARATGEGAR